MIMNFTAEEWHSVHNELSRSGCVDPKAPVQAEGMITIKAPHEIVWDLLADVTRWPHIRADIQDVTSPYEIRPEATFLWSTQGMKLTSQFGPIKRPHFLCWSTSGPGLLMTARYEINPGPQDHSVVSCREALHAPDYPQLGSAELRHSIRTWLEGLKALVERPTSRDHPSSGDRLPIASPVRPLN